MANEGFVFPDEVAKKAVEPENDKLDIEIIDDTPLEDRHRDPMPKKLVEDLENDNLEKYSKDVAERISQARKVYHDERRAKEAATREKEEAISFARTQYEENQSLKKRLGAGEKVFIAEVTKSATSEFEIAKERYKKALEDGDADKIIAAQQASVTAQLKLDKYADFKPSSNEESDVVQQRPQTRAPASAQVDSKAAAWQSKNSWFGKDEEMTALALGVHEKLVRSGVDVKSDDYYDAVDASMKKRFPEKFEEESTTQPETKGQRKSTTIVAPATRSSAPRQIRLTASQAALAKRLGITAEAYAREQIKLESNNG